MRENKTRRLLITLSISGVLLLGLGFGVAEAQVRQMERDATSTVEVADSEMPRIVIDAPDVAAAPKTGPDGERIWTASDFAAGRAKAARASL